MTLVTTAEIKQLARAEGFDLAGIGPAGPVDSFAQYEAWLAEGCHGTMDYLARHAALRRDVRAVMPEARSAIVCALSYVAPRNLSPDPAAPPHVSCYAWGRDYHRVMRKRLKALHRRIEARLGRPVRARAAVDTAPLLERALAARAGLGWIGKNTLLIHPLLGSFLFLGVLLTDLDLEPDTPIDDHCARCGERCREACPTQALDRPRHLDARRCIAYLTIEHRGPIDVPLQARLGPRVFGCDTCQDVCPWNRRARERLATIERAFWPSAFLAAATLDDLAALDEAGFRAHFTGTPVLRARWDGWQRNIAIARHNDR